MKLLCRLFGHALPKRGWWGDALYGRVSGGYVDGIGRSHFQVHLECPRCGEHWMSARFHGSAVLKNLSAHALQAELGQRCKERFRAEEITAGRNDPERPTQ